MFGSIVRVVAVPNAALLRDLAQDFIDNGYNLKALMRRIATSDVYQLSSRYPGQWRPAYVKYFARHEARDAARNFIMDCAMQA